ncbi:MAG: hypothetical protein FWH03_02570 [Firmicutes bacterium]|nr:hypothetical protein [Bacillota bacterium]
MIKLWVKTKVAEKLTRDHIFRRNEKFDIDKFTEYLMEICYELDIPTPVVLSSHINNFFEFNTVRFKPDDFVEAVDFEVFIIENAAE